MRQVRCARHHTTAGLNADRVEHRRSILARLDKLQRQADLQPEAFNSLDEHYKTAFNMITSPDTKRAFAIDQEEASLRDAYGRTKFRSKLSIGQAIDRVRCAIRDSYRWRLDTHQDNFQIAQEQSLAAGRPGAAAVADRLGAARDARFDVGIVADRLWSGHGCQLGQWPRPLELRRLCDNGGCWYPWRHVVGATDADGGSVVRINISLTISPPRLCQARYSHRPDRAKPR